MQNTIMQKSEFSKMRDCSGFLQIGSHIIQRIIIFKRKCTLIRILADRVLINNGGTRVG